MTFLIVIAVIVHLSGSLAGVRDTWMGRTKPNRVTFFMWAFAAFIGVAAAMVQGVTWAVLPVFLAGLGPFLIFLASFHNKNAAWRIGRFDWICGALSMLALILWGITREPNIAILFAIISDAVAAIPTIKKSWTHPETETKWVYLGATFSSTVGLIVAEDWSFAQVAFPIYLIAVCVLIFAFIVSGARRKDNLVRT